MRPADLEGIVVGSVMPERTAFQSHISSLAAEALGIKPSRLSARTEHMCASGTVGIRYAYAFIAAGLADLVMVLGVEKLNVPTPTRRSSTWARASTANGRRPTGSPRRRASRWPPRRTSRDYGTTDEQMALVSVKNHNHAARNPYAHFQKGATLDQVLCSRMIATPVPPVHVLAHHRRRRRRDRRQRGARPRPDRPAGLDPRHGPGAGRLHALLAAARTTRSWPALRRAGEQAYAMAGVGPDDVDLAEVHDCFAIAEIIAYEELGFCAKGEGGRFVEKGLSDYGGKVVVNPRGGLIGCGHPLGATGVAQAAEAFWQLRDEAGPRQVPGARLALTHNNSGMGEHVVMLYGRDEA